MHPLLPYFPLAFVVSLAFGWQQGPVGSELPAAAVNAQAVSTPEQTSGMTVIAKEKFTTGQAGQLPPQELVKAGVFVEYPLIGGISERKGKPSYVVIHSTETATEADAKRVIRSWNNQGRSHPGTPYVIDRDGTIYQTVHPDKRTLHVNDFRTVGGVNNSNSVGIEIVRTGTQQYTQGQRRSIVQLVTYLQQRYSISDEQVVGHGEIQPSTRTDPVNFRWERFELAKERFQSPEG
jgi:N-acetylmuramoyl-L-alanine amidase CwlA